MRGSSKHATPYPHPTFLVYLESRVAKPCRGNRSEKKKNTLQAAIVAQNGGNITANHGLFKALQVGSLGTSESYLKRSQMPKHGASVVFVPLWLGTCVPCT